MHVSYQIHLLPRIVLQHPVSLGNYHRHDMLPGSFIVIGTLFGDITWGHPMGITPKHCEVHFSC